MKVVFLALIMTSVALAGCNMTNEAIDTLYQRDWPVGESLYSGSFNKPLSGHEGDTYSDDDSFVVDDETVYLRIFVAHMFSDDAFDITVEDDSGSILLDVSFHDEAFEELVRLEKLEGDAGEWTIFFTTEDRLLHDVSIDVVASDDMPNFSDSFQEDRDHHFVRLYLLAHGWDGPAQVTITDPSGAVVFDRSITNTRGEIREQFNSEEGQWKVKIDHGDFTGWMDLKIQGVFQGQG